MVNLTEAIQVAQQIVTFINETLPLLKKISLSLKQFFAHSSTTAAITTKLRDLQQRTIECLLQLKGGFFNTCKSLATYGTDEKVHDSIKKELSQIDSERENLKQFADFCNKQFNTAIESYVEFCNASANLLQQLTAVMEEGFDIQNKKQRRSITWKLVGSMGIFAAIGAGLVALSPIAVPATVLIGGAVAGVVGIASGALGRKLEPISEEDLKILKQSIEELERFKGMLRRARRDSIACKSGPISAAIRDTNARKIIKIEKKGQPSEDSQDEFTRPYDNTDYIKCIPLDDEELSSIKKETVISMLEEFKTQMKDLLDKTEKALIAIDKDLESIESDAS